jgi:RecQ mediated genome instability protein
MSLLSLDLPPGSKVKLRASHTPIRRGTAMLSAECLVLLGGSVERLVGFKPLQGLDSSETHKMDVVQSGAGQMPPPLFNSRPTQVFAQKQQQPIHQQQQQQQQYSTQNQNNSNSQQMDSVRSVHPVTDFQASSSSSSSRGPNVQASSAINSIIGHDPLPSPALSSSKPSLQSAPPQVRRQQDEYVVGGRSDANTNASYGGVRVRVASPVSSRDADQVLDLCSPGTPPPHSPRKNSDESLLVAVRRVEDSRLHGSLKSADSGAAPVRGDRDPLVTSAANLYTPQSHSRLGVLPTVAQPGPAAHSSAPLPASASSSGWNSPAMKHQVPQSANSSSTTLDGRVRKAPLSVSASVNLSVSANQYSNALPYVSLATVAAAMSAGADTGADVGHSRKLPQGDFNVRGTAVNIRKFRVTEADGYLVLLSLEEEAADRDVPMGGSVVVPVLVSNDLCVKYLELAPTDYLLKLKNIGKEEIKSVKTSHSLKFRDFRGSFRARLAPSSALPGDRGLSGGTGATPSKSSSSSATSQGEDPLLLLVDFYE